MGWKTAVIERGGVLIIIRAFAGVEPGQQPLESPASFRIDVQLFGELPQRHSALVECQPRGYQPATPRGIVRTITHRGVEAEVGVAA